jgi:hypothetical protein
MRGSQVGPACNAVALRAGTCPEAVAIDASEKSKIERRLADIVENFIRDEVVGAVEW